MTQTRSQNREPLASLRAEWLLQENKRIKIKPPYDFFGKSLPSVVSRPEQWTTFTDGFCARGGIGGFYVGDFNDEDKPAVKFIPWKKMDNKDVRVTSIKPISQGRFAAVVEDAKEDTLVIIDAKSKDPSKSVASVPLPDTRRGSDRNFNVNVAIYDCMPEGFKLMIYRPIVGADFVFQPNRLSFQFTEGLNTFTAIDSLINVILRTDDLCHDMLFFKDNYIYTLNCKYHSMDELVVYSLNQEYQHDHRYAFYKHLKYSWNLQKTLIYPTTASNLQLYSHPQSNLLLVAEDYLPKVRCLSFWELEISPRKDAYHVNVKSTITDEAQLFSNPIILPENKVIYIASQNGSASSTIFLYDPGCAAPAPIYEFIDAKVEEIFLTPKGNMAVGYHNKKGEEVCEIYPIPKAKLTEKEALVQAISEAFPTTLAANDIASVIADYAYQKTQTWSDWVLGRESLSPVRYSCAVLKREGLFAEGVEKALVIDRIKNISDELEDLQQKFSVSFFNLMAKYSEADEIKVREELNHFRQIANDRHAELPRLMQLQPHHPDLKRLDKLLDDKWENHFEKQINEIRKANISCVKGVIKRGVSP